MASRFVTSFRTTFIFYASPSDFFIKSYDRLKFCHVNFWKHQIYHYSLRSKDSYIKYIQKQNSTKKFGSKINFYLILMNFTILPYLVQSCCTSTPMLHLFLYFFFVFCFSSWPRQSNHEFSELSLSGPFGNWQLDSLRRFEQLSFFTHLHLTSLSIVLCSELSRSGSNHFET